MSIYDQEKLNLDVYVFKKLKLTCTFFVPVPDSFQCACLPDQTKFDQFQHDKCSNLKLPQFLTVTVNESKSFEIKKMH